MKCVCVWRCDVNITTSSCFQWPWTPAVWQRAFWQLADGLHRWPTTGVPRHHGRMILSIVSLSDAAVPEWPGKISPRGNCRMYRGNFILIWNSRLTIDLTVWYQPVTVSAALPVIVGRHCQLVRNTVGGTPVFGRQTDPVLRSACSRRVTTMWVNRLLQVSQLVQICSFPFGRLLWKTISAATYERFRSATKKHFYELAFMNWSRDCLRSHDLFLPPNDLWSVIKYI